MEALAAAGVHVGLNPTEAGEKMVEIVKALVGRWPDVAPLRPGVGLGHHPRGDARLGPRRRAGRRRTGRVAASRWRARPASTPCWSIEPTSVASPRPSTARPTATALTAARRSAPDRPRRHGRLRHRARRATFHDAFPGRVLNTHPSLLPAFKGWHAVAQALAAGVSETGCTVHVATEELDDGPILAQRRVPRAEPGRRRGDAARADQGGRAELYPRWSVG